LIGYQAVKINYFDNLQYTTFLKGAYSVIISSLFPLKLIISTC